MGHTETGTLLTVLIVSTVVHGASALVATAFYVYLWFNLAPILSTDSDQTVCAKIARRYRHHMAGLAAIGCLALCLASGGMIVHLGTVHRDGDGQRVNWSYFGVGESVAFAALGGILGVFFWFPSVIQCVILAAIWCVSCILLGAGAVYSETDQRLFCFIASVLLQVSGAVFLFLSGSGFAGVLRSGRGMLAVGKLAVAAALYDVFWYIGYLNRPQDGVHIHTRWIAHLVFFLASVVAHICLPAFAAWFYTTEAAQAQREMNYASPALAGAAVDSAL
jgi:hypothetical protein